MEIGRVLGERYEITRALAAGATGSVWAARDASSGEEVAVKAISLESAGWRAEVRDRFAREAALLRLSPHPHLVGVRDDGETEDGWLYLVLDLLEGETLADRLAREPKLAWREAAEIALALARGLAALHEKGIVHRDLKPANVILHRAGPGDAVPKILDLGISKVRAAAVDPELFATLTATGQVLGTPQYMSYEQALGEREIDARSDVWSLGVVLFEMLAGRVPFTAPNVNATLAAIRRQSAPELGPLARGAPPALVEVARRCLEREPAARFADGAAVAAALEAALETAKEPLLPRRPLWLVAAALLAVLAVGALLAGRGRPDRPAGPSATAQPEPVTPPTAQSPSGETQEPEVPAPPSALAPPPPTSAPGPSGRGRRPPASRIDDAGF